MTATTQQVIPGPWPRDTRSGVEAVYFRSMGSGAVTPTVPDRTEQVFGRHLQLAARRLPGTALVRVYRPEADGDLGPAVQLVTDDMPLLVDSVTAAVRRWGADVVAVVHPVIAVIRDSGGRLTAVAEPGVTADRSVAESWIHLQLNADAGPATLDRIERGLPPLLDLLRRVDDDTPEMTDSLLALADTLGDAESARLLRWLADGHFTLLGAAGYPGSGDAAPGPCWGILRDRPELAALGTAASASAADDDAALRLSLGSLDEVLPGTPDGCVITVTVDGRRHVYIGAFTVTGSHEDILYIPVVRERVRRVIERSGASMNSFTGQALLEALQSFPRAELFATDADRLFETVSVVPAAGQLREVRLFLRQDAGDGAVYCLVYLPRDRYSAATRTRLREVLRAELGGAQVDYTARVTESELATLYFTVHRRPGEVPADLTERNRARIEQLLTVAARSWADRVVAAAAPMPAIGPDLAHRYATLFPESYRQEREPEQALADALRLRQLPAGAVDSTLYRRRDAAPGEWRFTLYVAGAGVSLSRILPVLHSLGVEVVDERPYAVGLPDGIDRWIYDFGLRLPVDLPGGRAAGTLRDRVSAAVEALWGGAAEVDGLNELVLRAGLGWRVVTVLRAYAKYLRQAGFAYGLTGITRVLVAHPGIAALLVELFEARFDPDLDRRIRFERVRVLTADLQERIDAVAGLDADRILRALLDLTLATLRTNYFRVDADGQAPAFLSLKLDAIGLAELPEPRPRFEIFVYSPRVEGVHLRFGAVARGGLRWSDRLEDFRTEILGLVKAQAVKNAVIVPVGAKGGFVVKRPPVATGDAAADRAAAQAEGIACYRTFISGLLDLTDNTDRGSGEVLPPPRVVRYDGDDTYLVVAADKGTATFSDIANEVAARYGFWLGDAFASGGSIGYDHKAMGITAKGAWESVKRHFAELGIDTQTTDFTVVGVGDMSGDVFGNGMLLSEHIRLVAAFDHRHIFLDPDPVAAVSFRERQRMFALPRSSWADYDTALISAGGGVYDRSSKSIPVSPQVRAALGLDARIVALAPPELIRAILLAPVDLLWNGGIGTYVKASTETDAQVGDKSNDAVRVDAISLRAKVIGEGGNLGLTALGRIEFARAGGRCNTDAVDNSAGVDCSDHEVNIKVLLDGAVAAGELSPAERNDLLAAQTDEVAALVLRDNISQNRRLGLSRSHAAQMAPVHRRLLAELESRTGLDRRLEALPDEAELKRRIAAGTGLTSPELSNLLAHVKLALKDDLLAGGLPDSPAFGAVLPQYVPAPLRERFAAGLRAHPLRRQIIATEVVNRMVDNGGITYAFRLAEQAGATTEDAVRAYTAVTEIFDLPALWQRIRTAAVPAAQAYRLELETDRTLDRASRWLLAHRPQPIAVAADIARYRDGVRALGPRVDRWLAERPAAERLVSAQAPGAEFDSAAGELVREVSALIHHYALLDVIDIAEIADRDPEEVADLYFALDDNFGIQSLLDAVTALDRGDRWHALARLAVRDDLYGSLRAVTLDVLQATAPEDSPAAKIADWESRNRTRLTRTRATLTELAAADTLDMAALAVAARQLRTLAGTPTPKP
ncbi:NAD-glutamate dehydrogenase [Nocardia stercoris]|uniref:NAD-glutamate dehydrogenase n=1 Tax=Nocardia stercoris TaxID=2483361 RepID=A0A3M2KXX7_9NOCA|nr:NAD-glutamate dehydrogenase [Nocardia stercoris]RMI29506.1 NAD-glutamate dehydrogenase [Nocardia stercoris]